MVSSPFSVFPRRRLCCFFRYGGENFIFLSIDILSPELACLPALWGSLFTDIKAVMDGTRWQILLFIWLLLPLWVCGMETVED